MWTPTTVNGTILCSRGRPIEERGKSTETGSRGTMDTTLLPGKPFKVKNYYLYHKCLTCGIFIIASSYKERPEDVFYYI